MSKAIRVLMVGDSEDDALHLIGLLKKRGYKPDYDRIETAQAMRKALAEKPWDVVLCEYKLPQLTGLAALSVLKETGIDIPFFLVSGTIDEEIVVEAMKAGAHECLMKGNLSRLVPAIERELRDAAIRREKKRAEEKLKQNEQLLSDTQRISKVGGWEYDVEKKRITWTDEVYRIYAVEKNYDIYDIQQSLSFFEDRSVIEDTFLKAVQDGISYDIELRFRAADGKAKWVRTSGYSVRENGRIVKVYGYIIDISEQRQLLEDAIQARRDWENIFQAIGHPTVILDPGHVILDANSTMVSASGLSREELIGRKCYEIFHGPDCTSPPDGCPMEKLLASGRAEKVESEMEAMGGFWWVSCTPVPDRHGRTEKIIHIAADITERKQAEYELRAVKRLQDDIIEFLPDATLVIDREGRVVAWNRAIEEMTGIAARDMLGKGDYEYALPFYGKRRPILLDTALRAQLESERGYTNIRRAGKIISGETVVTHLPRGNAHLWVTSSMMFDEEGKIVAAIKCIRDVTEIKKAQKDVKEAEERFRGIFVNAHDGIYRSTLEGKIVLANRTMAKIFGYASPEEFLTCVTDIAGQHYVHPEHYRKIFELLAQKGAVHQYEAQIRSRDGISRWISTTAWMVLDKDGRPLYFDGIIEDATTRKEILERLRKALEGTVQAISMSVEKRDPYTAGHQRRTADLARSIATEMGFTSDRLDFIRTSSIIHDIGKIALPAEILSKPAKLTDIEFSLVRTHAVCGYDILKDIEFPWPVADVVLQHHERLDGSGYPDGLRGDDIILEARILAVADVVEAIASHRPYRPARGVDEALDELIKNRGVRYDGAVVDMCVRLIREKQFSFADH